jgi:hypothetical protein
MRDCFVIGVMSSLSEGFPEIGNHDDNSDLQKPAATRVMHSLQSKVMHPACPISFELLMKFASASGETSESRSRLVGDAGWSSPRHPAAVQHKT